jgi:hypothetical protein
LNNNFKNLSAMQNNKNFQNRAFEDLFASITNNMPALTFFGIILTYGITAALTVFFLPLPAMYAVPAALAVQFGRFAVVFTDFLNPTGKRSPWPPVIATGATIVALVEFSYSVQDMQLESTWTDARYWSVYLFGSMLIVFGYILELNFISKGAEGYGMQRARVMPGSNATNVTQRVRNVAAEAAEAIAPQRRNVIAGFQQAEKATAQPGKVVETREQPSEVPADLVRGALKSERAKLRAYRHKELNGIGNAETVAAGIARAEAEIQRLEGML